MKLDPVTLAVMNNRLAAIAEEMGVVLGQTGLFAEYQRTARLFLRAVRREAASWPRKPRISLSISARLRFRCALRSNGWNSSHGDVAILNDPFAGGTHLPDVTVVTPIFLKGERKPFAYAANRAHHADIGGMAPGSMALSTEIYQEGFRLPPVKLYDGRRAGIATFSSCFWPIRACARSAKAICGRKRRALRVGAERMRGLVATGGNRRGRRRDGRAQGLRRSPDARDVAAVSNPGRYEHTIISTTTVSARVRSNCASRSESAAARAIVDFTGSAPQVRGSVNANYAITLSATFYVMKCLAAEAVPANEGLLRPIKLIAPQGSIVNALPPAAVAGGNVETSQRIVDVLFRALAQAAPDRIAGGEFRLDVEPDDRRL